MDRKELVKTLGEFLGVTPKYLGAPSFAYEIKTDEETYTIDRQGSITTLEGSTISLNEILNPEHHEESVIDGLELEIPFQDHTGRTLLNIINMVYSKQQLIMMSLELREPFMDESFIESLNLKKTGTIEEFQEAISEVEAEGCKGITFDFEKGTLTFKLLGEDLNSDKIEVFKELGVLINQNAKKLKHTSFKQAQDDNPKYAFRTWLIRLGMNGSEYKDVRKALLSNLEGSSAFRKISGERSAEING